MVKVIANMLLIYSLMHQSSAAMMTLTKRKRQNARGGKRRESQAKRRRKRKEREKVKVMARTVVMLLKRITSLWTNQETGFTNFTDKQSHPPTFTHHVHIMYILLHHKSSIRSLYMC